MGSQAEIKTNSILDYSFTCLLSWPSETNIQQKSFKIQQFDLKGVQKRKKSLGFKKKFVHKD